MTTDALVFQNRFQLFIGHASFFHFALSCLFAKIALCAVQYTKCKLIHVFRKIENIQLWHFVSSVAQICNLSSQKKVMLNFVLCVYFIRPLSRLHKHNSSVPGDSALVARHSFRIESRSSILCNRFSVDQRKDDYKQSLTVWFCLKFK